MKYWYFSFLILILFNENVCSQNILDGTNWVRVKCERKDGSKFFNHNGTYRSMLEYNFLNNTDIKIITPIGKYDQKYSLQNQKLIVGKIKFDIEYQSNKKLILTEILSHETTGDKIGKFHFIRKENLVGYLKKNNILKFHDDQTIILNKYFNLKTHNNKSIYEIVGNAIMQITSNSFFAGNFIIDTSGQVKSIIVKENYKTSKKQITQFKSAIQKVKFLPLKLDNKIYNRYIDYGVVLRNIDGFAVASINPYSSKRPCI